MYHVLLMTKVQLKKNSDFHFRRILCVTKYALNNFFITEIHSVLHSERILAEKIIVCILYHFGVSTITCYTNYM